MFEYQPVLTVDADQVWRRIVSHSGAEFRLKGGKPFTYTASGRTIDLHSTNRNIGRAHIERALRMCPLEKTVPLQSFSAPSYIYALLTDPRIRSNDW